jgi:hypothetical protein
MTRVFVVVAILVLSGCVSTSKVVEVEENYYFVTSKDIGGVFSKDGKVIGRATQEARAFCQSLGKKADIKELKRNPEGPLEFETSDIYFSCE